MYEYVTRFDTETQEGGLFEGYIDTFLKLKSQASGYPISVRSPAEEERYIESFWKSEVFRLDREEIKPKGAKRVLAKLCLNFMCGIIKCTDF